MKISSRIFYTVIILLSYYILIGASPPQKLPVNHNLQLAQNQQQTDIETESVQNKDIDPDLMQWIVSFLSNYFGIPESDIHPDMDLKNRFLADEMDIYELMVQICEAKGKQVASNMDITTVRSIAEYVQQAPYDIPAYQLTLRGSHDETDSKVPEKPKKNIYLQKVFFATDRKKNELAPPAGPFSGERSSSPEKLTFGRCEVAIPKIHVEGNLELPSSTFLIFTEEPDPKKHIIIQKIDILSWDSFIKTLNESLTTDLESEGSEDILLFVHGFNVPFDRAVMRTAQIAFDLRFQGAPILFSWPSDGSIFSYLSDREDVEWSVNHLETFISKLLNESQSQRIHLIAHSMGTQGLIRALNQISLRRGDAKGHLFENVILAAPDFDAQRFTQQLAPHITHLAKRWTLYTSDKDVALNASSILSVKRLGLPLEVVDGVDTVDATGIEVTPWSVPEFHSYYASKSLVISDFKKTLSGISPEKRDLIRQLKGKQPYWRIKTP